MTNIEKAQEYLNSLHAAMDLAINKAEKVPYDLSSAEQARVTAARYNAACYMMKLMTDAMLEQHVKDRNEAEKKYRY